MPTAEMITSALSSWPNGLRSDATMSMPLALASMRTRSWTVTISWSRSPGDSSRSQMPAIAKTTNPTVPAILYSCTQKAGLGFAPMVWLATTNTIRLPTTGPLVQKPIAVARPTCGEKSRIRAAVAIRQAPSTRKTR